MRVKSMQICLLLLKSKFFLIKIQVFNCEEIFYLSSFLWEMVVSNTLSAKNHLYRNTNEFSVKLTIIHAAVNYLEHCTNNKSFSINFFVTNCNNTTVFYIIIRTYLNLVLYNFLFSADDTVLAQWNSIIFSYIP